MPKILPIKMNKIISKIILVILLISSTYGCLDNLPRIEKQSEGYNITVIAKTNNYNVWDGEHYNVIYRTEDGRVHKVDNLDLYYNTEVGGSYHIEDSYNYLYII